MLGGVVQYQEKKVNTNYKDQARHDQVNVMSRERLKV